MSDYETLLVERRDTIATVTVNRPDALNALNRTVLQEVLAVAEALGEDDTLDAVVVTGAGRAFVAGADIKAMLQYGEEEAREFSRLGHLAFNAVSSIGVPVIAAVNGFALGGGLELALACDLIYGSEKARMGLPEVSLGVIPGWGGTQRLGRRIGWHRARELVLTARQVKAEEAREIGLLLDVFPADELIDRVNEVADSIASNGPLAVRAARRAMVYGEDHELAEGLAFEQEQFGGLFGTDDQREGMAAFVERRDAEFTRS